MKSIPRSFLDEFIVLTAFFIFSFAIWFNYNVLPEHPKYNIDLMKKSDTSSQLLAGSSVVDITPEIIDTWEDVDGNGVYNRWVDTWTDNNNNGYFDAFWMAGFRRSKPAQSILEPLSVRATIIKKGDFSVGLVAIDTVGLPYGETIKVRLDKDLQPLTHLIIASIHTHSAPDTLGYWTPYGVHENYTSFLRKKIVEALKKAQESIVPCNVQLTKINMLDEIRDIRLPPEKIVAKMTGIRLTPTNPNISPTILSFGGCHPTLLGRNSTKISPDWVGYFRKAVENKTKATCIFFNGAIGGHIIPKAKEEGVPLPIRIKSAKTMASVLGNRLRESFKTAQTIDGKDVPLSIKAKTILIPIENKTLWAAIGIGYFGRGTFFPMKIRTEVGILEIGEVKAITMPGELFPEQFIGGEINPVGADFKSPPLEVPPLKEILKSSYPVLIGLANDETGYIIPYSEFDKKKPHLNNRDKPYEDEELSIGPHMALTIHKALIKLNNRHF